jgi:hypothetical protein
MMSTRAGAHSKALRDVLRIGQVWARREPHGSIQIKQIHRADRLVEAWFDTPRGPEAHGVSFADLRRDYELVE